MSSSDPPTLTPDSQPSLSSVWSCHCNGPVKDIQISPHGVVAVSTENCVNLYAGAPNFGTSQELSVAPATLTAYKFSADGADLITGASDGRLRWWEVPRGEEACSTQFPLLKAEESGLDESGGVNPAISSIACAKEGDLVAAAGGRTICIFASGARHVHTIGPLTDTILGLEWRTNGELAVNVGIAICVFTVDKNTVTPGAQYAADGGGLTVLASAPSGKMLAAGCTNGSVRIWDLGSEAEGKISVHIKGFLNSPDAAEQVKCLAWDEMGHFLATAGGSDVIVWDMEDANSEEGKDNSIVCYGHGQNAKITALKFQPNGKLLATGGDDCQVALFDSSNFNSNGMVGGLVGSIVSVRVGHEAEGSSITALAWHPSGLILAGTTQGKVDAFEVAQAEPEIASNLSSTDLDKPFLIKRDVAGRHQQLSNMPPHSHPHPQPQPHRSRNNHRQAQAGWGGEPLITTRLDDTSERQNMGFGNRRRAANGGRQPIDPISAAGRGGRPTKNKAKTMFHEINSIKHSRMARPAYSDGQQQPPPHQQPPSQPPQQQQASWAMMPAPMVGWPNPYGPQVPYPQMQYGMPPGGVPNSPMPPYNQPPVSQPSEVTRERGAPNALPRGPTQSPQQQQQQQQPGVYPMGYVPYAHHYRMPYPTPYGYYPPMGQHMPMQDDAMPPQPPPAYVAQTGPAPPIASARSGTRDFPRPISSTDLNEDAASKSSEATNNGVNSMAPVTPSESSVSGYDHDGGRALQTLYIGNLAPQVDENLLMQSFASFGPIMNIQVIRDRDTRLSRGFAFVTYNHPMYAQIAMQHMDTMQLFGPFEGRRLKVSFSNRR